jgi:hypothetical protein
LGDPTVIGTVQDVRGSTVSVALTDDTVSGLSFVDGNSYRLGQVGSFVRIPLGFVSLFGVVSQVGAGAVPERQTESRPFGNRWLTIQLVGEGKRGGVFQRGISQYPTIGDAVHLVTDDDLRVIYGRPESSAYLRVGAVASVESIPALVDVNRLVSRHSAVVGATGSGKSTTVAALLTRLSDGERYPSARVLLIDIHGEYAAALKDRANVFRINPSGDELPLLVPYWALTFDELQPLTFGALEDAARTSVMDLITQAKQNALKLQPRRGVTVETLTVDTPLPFSRETAPAAAEAVRRIVKEGRKYGLAAMIVSQRPAEIDQTILSQCGTVIALRLANEVDRRHVSSAASDNLEGLFSMLPTLRVGEAIIVGEAVTLPIRAMIEPPDPARLPDSQDPKAVVPESSPGEFETPGGWNQRRDPDDYQQVMEVWRQQNPRPSRREKPKESEK